MRIHDTATDRMSRPRPRGSIGLVRAASIASAIVVGLLALWVVPLWLKVLTPRWLVRRASIAILWGLLGAVVAAAPAALVLGPWSVFSAAQARRRGDRAAAARGLRGVLLASSVLIGLVAMEAASSVVIRSGYNIPELPIRFADDRDRRGPAGTDPIDIVVIGESSARGEPYHPWLSVGQIVGWQLGRVFPGREVRVDVRADGGLCLEQAVLRLVHLERRPEALIVFAGHNEFQTRFGWSRNVRHYVEEGPESPLALLELGRSASSTIALILQSLDRHYGSTPTPRHITRELVDHPICTPAEHAFLREDYRRRLDALASYCGRIGTLPILIVPPSNDGSFEPSRSVLSGDTPAEARREFARAFLAARAIEADDPGAALAAFRRLAYQHPEFAEAHYRLARSLMRAGARDEAREHFIRARDLDALPLRCPSDFRDAVRAVARRHGALLIDAPERLSGMVPAGILDDRFFHDAQHVNLAGIVALAQDVLEQLHGRRAFGWPDATPVPRIEVEETARHFGVDAARWAVICERSADFFARAAFIRYDPEERLQAGGRFTQAARDLAAGRPLPQPAPPGLDLPISILRPSATATGELSPREIRRILIEAERLREHEHEDRPSESSPSFHDAGGATRPAR